MKHTFALPAALALATGFGASTFLLPAPAEACGGFFCSRTPVDQAAERILFEVDGETVRATIQISYSGAPEDFAWVLPAPSLPVVEDTFPQRGLIALDVATGPQFNLFMCDMADGGPAGEGEEEEGGEVVVHDRRVVGPFDVAVVSSEDSRALIDWLHDNGYRITEAMEPYVRLYVAEGMVFVAMKLVPDADTADIAPIVVSWAGDQPMIPLRLTAVAAEPEMGVTTWILSDRRYHSANFADIEPDWGQIRVDWDRAWQGGGGTNYLQLVARWADQHDGQAFITEYAQPTAPLLERFENQFVPEDDEEAQEANRRMIQILRRHSYLTRLYTRLSPEEMGADPVFQPGPAEGGNVENFIDLPEAVIGDGCGGPGEGDLAADACDFVACGAGGACFLDGEGAPGCACLDGAVARTVMEGGRDATTCQDRRLSFPDAPDVPAFGAVCAEFDCGEGGQCVNMNGTPTCECDRGLIAVGRFQPVDDGAPLRFTRCVSPAAAVPEEFYERTLGDLPIDLPPAEGEGEVVPPAEGEGEIPPPNGGDGGGSGGTPRKGPSDDGLCSVGPGSSSAALAPLLLVGLCVLGRRRRR